MELKNFSSSQERINFFHDLYVHQKDFLHTKICTEFDWFNALDFTDRGAVLRDVKDKDVYSYPAFVLLKNQYITKARAQWWMHSKRRHLLNENPILISYFTNEVLFYQGWLYGQFNKQDKMMDYDELYKVLTTFNTLSNTPYLNPNVIKSVIFGLDYQYKISRDEIQSMMHAIIGINDMIWPILNISDIIQDYTLHPEVKHYLEQKTEQFRASSCAQEISLIMS